MKSFFSDINWRAAVITLFAVTTVGALFFWVLISAMGGLPWSENQARTYWTENKPWIKTIAAEIDQGKPYSQKQLTELAKKHGIVDIQNLKVESGSYTIFIFSRTGLDNTMGVFNSKNLNPTTIGRPAPMSYTWSVWSKPLETNWHLIKGT